MTIFERVRALELPEREYAVFGSGLLEALGIRRAKDVDLIVTPSLYGRLREHGWHEVRGENATTLNRDGVEAALPSEYVPASAGIDEPEALLHDTLDIEGISFVRPEYLIACKRGYNRPKHLEDVEMLERYLAEHPELAKP